MIDNRGNGSLYGRRFEGRVAMISGGAAGIGAASAERLHAEGASLAVLDLDAEALARRYSEYTRETCFFFAGDSTNPDDVGRFHEEAITRFGRIDILFNNMGRGAGKDSGYFEVSREETWRTVMELSLFTTMRLTRLVAPAMKESRYGRIINMSSDAAFVGDEKLAEYAAAKMGVVGFTRVLARELAPFGVTANVIAPGAIRTAAHDRLPPAVINAVKEGTPAKFVGEPEDVAAAVAFLASEESRFITGQSLLIDGGRWLN